MSTEMPDAQGCKRNAIEAMSRLEDLTDQRVSQGALLLQAAQVWATLATVPEPLEELTAIAPVTAELVFGDNLPPLPVLVCPHGYQARIDTIVAEDRPVQLRYTWNDCPSPSCP